mmetsp:Transcript_31331/g.91752  ORF Transcript_31331/g.91752 Transcript_31331/m.91752 type:complete len:621 (-) Transcript_31331:133-1995(-)
MCDHGTVWETRAKLSVMYLVCVSFKLLPSLFLAVLGSSVSIQDLQGLLDLGAESIRTLQKMEELGVVHLEEHAGDLASELRLRLVDEGVETLANHVLLHLGAGRSESAGGEALVSGNGRLGLLGRHLLLGRGRGDALLLGRHVAGLLVELHVLLATATSTAASTALVRVAATTASAGSLLGHAAVLRHGVHAPLLLLLHHGVGEAGTAGHHGVGRLHTAGSGAALLHVHTRHAAGVAHGHGTTSHAGLASAATGVASLELGPTDLLALGKGDEDGLGADDLAVHLVDGPGGLLGGGVADEAEASRPAVLHVLHDAGRSDGAHGGELVAKDVVGDGIVEVLDVEVDALELGDAVHLLGFELGAEFALALGLLLRSADEHLEGDFLTVDGAGELLAVEALNGIDGTVVIGVGDEAISKGLDLGLLHLFLLLLVVVSTALLLGGLLLFLLLLFLEEPFLSLGQLALVALGHKLLLPGVLFRVGLLLGRLLPGDAPFVHNLQLPLALVGRLQQRGNVARLLFWLVLLLLFLSGLLLGLLRLAEFLKAVVVVVDGTGTGRRLHGHLGPTAKRRLLLGDLGVDRGSAAGTGNIGGRLIGGRPFVIVKDGLSLRLLGLALSGWALGG